MREEARALDAWVELAWAGLDGLLVAVICVASAGTGGRMFVQAVAGGPAWLPVGVWGTTSLWALLTALLALARLREGRAPARGVERVGQSAAVLLVAFTLAPTLVCALGLIEPWWPVCFSAPLSAAGAAWAVGGAPPGGRRRRALLVAACLLLLLLLLLTWWPLRLTTWLARRPLEALAARVEAGQAPAGPEWVGPLRIASTERRGRAVFLITVPDPGGAGGLVRSRDDRLPFNLGTVADVGGGWLLVFED